MMALNGIGFAGASEQISQTVHVLPFQRRHVANSIPGAALELESLSMEDTLFRASKTTDMLASSS